MALAPKLEDINHEWGQDITLSPTGDLGRVSGLDRSRQRVLRRLLTNLGEYLWEPDYGGSLPKRIGQHIDLAKIKAVVKGQMFLEPSVSRNPAPTITVRELTGGVAVAVQYIALPDKQPVSLSFDLTG